jgi:glycosyltransferase involved in cell wall biosynthesis
MRKNKRSNRGGEMRVLWLCNIPIPKISKDLGTNAFNIGGWLAGMATTLSKSKEIQLFYCFPQRLSDKIIEGEIENIKYYGFPNGKTVKSEDLLRILNEVNPEIFHIWGTENEYSYKMAKLFDKPEKIVVNIQGMVSMISKHYYSGLPFLVRYRFTMRDIIKKNNIFTTKKLFERKGIAEKKLIKFTHNVIGRTEWDKACTSQINPRINYFSCNETLRDSFYEGKWDIKKCEKYSLFLSQAMYPIKGLHFLLEALKIVVEEYPETHLYIAGHTIKIIPKNKYEYLIQSSYARYLYKIIKKNNLEKNITFLGNMSEEEMYNQYKNTHIFISPSSLENESNSLSEAKLLGVPCIASYVGGVIDRIKHGHDGFFYQHDAPYMLAHYIFKIFQDDSLAEEISINGSKNMAEIVDKEINNEKMIQIYKKINKR